MRRAIDYLRRHHLGLIAIFIAFSGTAYANGLIGSAQIKSGAIQSRHIADSQVKGEDIANGAVSGVDLTNDSITGEKIAAGQVETSDIANGTLRNEDITNDTITGAKIDEATLDVASSDPNAQTLDGLDSTDFLRSNGTATNSARLGGDLPSAFLGANAKAADANLLDGLNSTDFLGSNAKAANADLLDGQDSSAFLSTAGKAADADLLDGMNSTAFLGASAKAADSNTLDGIDSTAFVQGGPATFTDAGLLNYDENAGCGAFVGWRDNSVEMPASYWRDPFGIVHLSGSASECNPSTYNSPVYYLPAGYRPEVSIQIPMIVSDGGANNARAVSINGSSGGIFFAQSQNPTTPQDVWFSGVTFRCGPSGVAGCP